MSTTNTVASMSNNTKTVVPLFLLVIVVALLLLACGSEDPIAEVVEASAPTETPVATTAPLEQPTAAETDTAAASEAESSTDSAGAVAQPADEPTAAPEPATQAPAAVAASAEPGTTTSTLAGINAAQWASNVTIALGSDSFRYTSNGLPSHELPDQFLIPNDGNMPPFTGDDISAEFSIVNTEGLIIASPLDVEITLNPVYASEVTYTGLSTIGVMLSGVPLFNDYEDQNREFVALDDNLSLDGVFFIDACNGHPLASGNSYHYHGVPYCITDAVDVAGQHSSIIGVLLDGFPIYGSKDVGGVPLTNADLDECSGHFGATPEFPDGIYHYHLTEDANPYSIDCFHGVIDYASNGPGGGGGGERPQGGERPEGSAPPEGERPEGGAPADGAAPEGGAASEGQTGSAPADGGTPPEDGGERPEGGTPPEGGGERPEGGPGGGGGAPDFASAAATLGISEDQLRNALGGPPPDFDAAAAALGISVADLQAALTAAGG